MFAIVSCLLYLKTKSLFPSIIAHIINNLIIVSKNIILGLQTTANSSKHSPQPELTSILIISTVLIIMGLIWIIPFVKRNWGLLKYDSLPSLKYLGSS